MRPPPATSSLLTSSLSAPIRRGQALTRRRPYHSHDRPPPPPLAAFSPAEQALLAAAYRHVPAAGFHRRALALGARDARLLDVSANLAPRGAFDLVRWHLATRREALAAGRRRGADAPAAAEADAAAVRERAEGLTWERLLGNREVIGRWQEALAIMAQPSYVRASLEELGLLVDDIWFLAGDTAVDSSWYTKRLSLSAIYTAAELFMTNDHSPGFKNTRDFVRRRFAETATISRGAQSIGEWVAFTGMAGLNAARNKGMNI